MKVKRANIDADLLLYEIGFLTKDDSDEPIDDDTIMLILRCRLRTILKGSGCDMYKMYLTGKGNFRNGVATIAQYKGGRGPRPELYDKVLQMIKDNFIHEVVDGMEADDKLAIDQTKYTVLCSRDKDLRMVEGWHYSWQCGKQKEKPLCYISHSEGIRTFYQQLLTGDKIDNIMGLSGTKGKPGFGPVKARKWLEDCTTEPEMYTACVAAYREKYGDLYKYLDWRLENEYERTPEDMLLENARLLYMIREEGELWLPPMK